MDKMIIKGFITLGDERVEKTFDVKKEETPEGMTFTDYIDDVVGDWALDTITWDWELL